MVVVIYLIIFLKFINVPSVFKHFDLDHIFFYFSRVVFFGGVWFGGVALCFHDEVFEKMKLEKAKRQVGADCYLFICLWLLLTRVIS